MVEGIRIALLGTVTVEAVDSLLPMPAEPPFLHKGRVLNGMALDAGLALLGPRRCPGLRGPGPLAPHGAGEDPRETPRPSPERMPRTLALASHVLGTSTTRWLLFRQLPYGDPDREHFVGTLILP